MPFALGKTSRERLAAVHPDLRRVVERAIVMTPQDFAVVQGNRTQAEQDALYAQGRTNPGRKVTWTRKSRHIGGKAVDLAAWMDGKPDWDDLDKYRVIALAMKAAACELGVPIVWGGDWTTTPDMPHFELDRSRYP